MGSDNDIYEVCGMRLPERKQYRSEIWNP